MKKTSKEPSSEVNFAFNELAQPLAVVAEGISLLKEYFDGHQDLRRKQIFNSVQTNLDRAMALLKGFADSIGNGESQHPTATHLDILQQIQQVCTTHDQMFLQRQLRYRMTASADLPKVFANPNQIFVVLSHIIANAIKYTPRSSEIEIRVKEISLRQGAGVEVAVINESPNFTEKDRYQIFEKFYTGKTEEAAKAAGMGLALCRETIQRSGGQMWVDIPSKGKVSFAFVLPCANLLAKPAPKGHQTYKYDITIANFKELREDIGAEKISTLLHRIEDSVRKLVRYPIDVVATFEANGVISTIYETQEGHASSVATRISQKLGEENFRIGKTAIPITFKYHLSILQ